MKRETKNIPFSRRNILGFSLLLPFMPMVKPLAATTVNEQSKDDEIVTMLRAEVGDFSSPEFESQTDGAFFYKITIGRENMTGF